MKWLLVLFLLVPASAWGQESLFEPLPAKEIAGDGILDIPTMHFSLLTQNKRNILVIWGGINQGDAQRVREALDAARPGEVWLTSKGGNAEEGIEIARILRVQRLTTRVVKGTECISACNYAFLGGTVRYVDTGAEFKAHMFANAVRPLIMRAQILFPPRNLLAFIHDYPHHEIFGGDDFMVHVKRLDKTRLLELIADKKQLPSDLSVPKALLQAANEFVSVHKGVPMTCPGDKRVFGPDGQLGEPPAQGQLQAQAEPPSKDRSLAPPEKKETAPPPEMVDIPDDPCAEEFLRTYLRGETASEEVKAIQQDAAQFSAMMARFLTEMSVSLRYMTDYANIHNDQPTALTHEELRSLNIINAD